jgi:hypothetical protein
MKSENLNKPSLWLKKLKRLSHVIIVSLTLSLTACSSPSMYVTSPDICHYGLVQIKGLSAETKKTLSRQQKEDLVNNNSILEHYCPITK